MRKTELDIVVSMYKELKEFVRSDGCDHSVGICVCGLYDLLEQSKVMIEKAARYHNLIPKKGKALEWVASNKKKARS
jgi:hypothetical protein